MNTSSWRRAVALGAACTALSTVPALATSSPTALAGTTTIVATRTSSVLVRLPRAVTLDLSAVRVTAPRGRLVAFALKQVGAWNAPLIVAVHNGYCGTSACTTHYPNASVGFVWAPGSTNGLSGTFPAGAYRIYVVTDGAPATFVLKIPGVSGTRRLSPGDRARGQVVAPAPSMAQPVQSPQMFAGGSTHRTGSAGGLNATAVWKDLANGVVPGATGNCVYDGAVPAGTNVPPYQAPCEGGKGGVPPFLSSSHDNGQNPSPAGPGHFFTTIDTGYLVPPGTFSLGGYNNTTGVVNAAYVHQVWLDF